MMLLVTGVSGMNPRPAAFAWVMWLIVASGVAALAVFFWQRLL